MSKAKELVKHFRRMSTSDMFRRSSKSDAQHVETLTGQARTKGHPDGDPKHPRKIPHPTLLVLPAELLAQILIDVTFKDLCSLRLVSSNANHLVSEGEILRQWQIGRISEHQTDLYPPPSPPTFTYLIEQERRACIVRKAAVLYADYIESKIVRVTLGRRDPSVTDQQHHDAFQPIWELIGVKLIPLLLTLQHHLENCATWIFNFCETESPHHSRTFRQEYATQERTLLEHYDPEHLRDVYNFWLFLAWVNNQILNQPSYVGTLERAVRGWMVDPLRHHDFSLTLLFGHLAALSQLMRLKSFKERTKAVESWIRRLNPASNVQWRAQWEKFGLAYGVRPTREQAEAALGVKLRAGEVFANSARALLVEQGLLEAESDTDVGTTQQCMDFLEETAGYDVLHVPPAVGLRQLSLD